MSMGAGAAIDWELWLKRQPGRMDQIFVSALDSLQEAGVRILTGSHPARIDPSDSPATVKLIPARFMEFQDEHLVLAMTASIKSGPPRYEIALRLASGSPTAALSQLAGTNFEVWHKFFLASGLWIRDSNGLARLLRLTQLSDQETDIALIGTFLHSDSDRIIKHGVMLLGTLYRAILDELNEVSTLAMLFRKLDVSIDSHRPTFRRETRP